MASRVVRVWIALGVGIGAVACGDDDTVVPHEGETTVFGTTTEGGGAHPLDEVSILFARGTLEEFVGTSNATGQFDVSLGIGCVTDGELVFRRSGYVEEREAILDDLIDHGSCRYEATVDLTLKGRRG